MKASDLTLIQRSAGELTVTSIGPVEVRRFTDGEHRRYEVHAQSQTTCASFAVTIVDLIDAPARAVRGSADYAPL